jgi:hypothetical protein
MWRPKDPENNATEAANIDPSKKKKKRKEKRKNGKEKKEKEIRK